MCEREPLLRIVENLDLAIQKIKCTHMTLQHTVFLAIKFNSQNVFSSVELKPLTNLLISKNIYIKHVTFWKPTTMCGIRVKSNHHNKNMHRFGLPYHYDHLTCRILLGNHYQPRHLYHSELNSRSGSAQSNLHSSKEWLPSRWKINHQTSCRFIVSIMSLSCTPPTQC